MQKGFIFPSLYIYLGLGAVIVGMGLFIKCQSVQLENCAIFKAETERLGLEAKAKAKQVEADNKLRKEKADNELKNLRSRNADLSKRLRDNASSSFLSSGETSARIPESACLNAGAVDEALRKFATGTAELFTEGQDAIDSLNNAKQWASPIREPGLN